MRRVRPSGVVVVYSQIYKFLDRDIIRVITHLIVGFGTDFSSFAESAVG